MKKVFFCFLLISVLFSYSQRQASNWFFGDGAGVEFNTNDDTVTSITQPGALFTEEGCSSISDGNGDLLFYTDGRFVYDSRGIQMPNGFGLFGDQSSTQSGLIIPKPQDPDIYYIFTVDTVNQNNPATDQGFNYSEVDMRLNGGFGDVTQKNIFLLRDSSEKISAVLKDCQTQSIWVITYSTQNALVDIPNNNNIYNAFYAFEVDATGVNTSFVSSGITDGQDFTDATDARGYLKLSPDGTKLACANSTYGLFLYDFDVTTGKVSNEEEISINFVPPNPTKIQTPYGLEFSPNNDFLYVSAFYNPSQPEFTDATAQYSSLLQYNLTATDINASEFVLDHTQSYRAALQLGPDRRIYRTNSRTYNDGIQSLSVINNPNSLGSASNFVENQVQLNSNSRQGLPPFIASFFVDIIDIINDPDITTTFLPLCEGELYTLSADNIPGATYTWSFDGVAQPTPAVPYEFEVFQNGLYEVLIELNTGDCETFEGEALVEYSPFPEAYDVENIRVCDDNLNDGVFNFDLSQQNTTILGGQDPMLYTVHYYTSEMDAINDENEISSSYQNTTNPEEIFVRVENVNNENCFKTTDAVSGAPISFLIEVYNTPTITGIDNIMDCDLDGDTTDGVITIDLAAFNATVLGSQNPMDYEVSYHESLAEAMSNTDPLPLSYQNDPFTDEVFIRVENNDNTECYTTDRFTITVNLTPEVSDIGLFQCDEDGIPDARTIFNITEKNDEITGGNPNFTVAYYLNMADATAENNPIDASSYENTSSPQIIIARVTDTTSDCFSLSEVTLEVSVTSANDSYLGVCDTDGVEDGFTVFDLSLANADVLDGLPAGLDLVYYENIDDALLEQNPLPLTFPNTVANNQIIYARVENNNNCYGINEVELEVLTLPNVETEFETLYCLNTFPEKIVLKGGVINDVPNNYYYDWSTGETTIEIEVNAPGTYTVRVSNVAGCFKDRTIIVTASNTATIDNIEVTDASPNNMVTVLVSGEGDYEYSLDDPNGVYQDSNSFDNVKPGIYTVFVRDKNGCGVSEELVSVVGFPKFFTPNGDGQNDVWQVKGISSQFQPDTIIYIYDRHGKLLSEVNPLGSGWDGTYNGNPMPASDYWFSVALQDGRRFSSHFSLKR